MNKKSIVSNIIWSVLSLMVSTAITMLILPFVSKRIGIEAYGFIALCHNFITYVDLVASAINIYAVKFISSEYHKNDLDKANIYFNSVLIANCIISLVLIIPSTMCVVYIDRLLDIPTQLIGDVRVLFSFTVLNYVLTLLGTVFSSAAFTKDILYKDTRIRAEGNILRGVVILALFVLLFPHVWYVTIAAIICSLYILLRNIRITRLYLPEITINPKYFSGKAVQEVASNGIWNSVASLGTMLNSGLDLLVTNHYLGALSMGQLSVPKTLSNFITQLLTAVTNSFRPQLLVFYTKGEMQKLNEGFKSSMKSCGFITCSIVSVFSAFGFQFLNLWIPNENIKLIYNLALLTFLAETFTGFVKPLHYGCVLTGKLKIPCVANLLVGLSNVVAMVLFLNITNGGLYVVTLTTVVGNIAYNFIIMPIYVTKILCISRFDMYKTIIRYIVVTSIVTAILFCAFHKLCVSGWFVLFVWLILASFISITLYLLGMFNLEEIRNLFKSVLQKIK